MSNLFSDLRTVKFSLPLSLPTYASCILLLISSVFCTNISLIAAENASFRELKTTEGTEFWLCFQRNFKESPSIPNTKSINELALELFVASTKDSKVSIDIDGIKYHKEVKITAGTVGNLKIDPAAQIQRLENAERLAVHIMSDNPITVYGLNSRFQTTDAFLGLPVSALGNEYMAMGYGYSEGLLSQFAVVATEDGTTVTITPTAITSQKHDPGVPYSIQLSRGEVFQVTSMVDNNTKTDLTGSKITSNKKIAVFSGHQCAYVPEGIVGCNHLVEQMPPINTWGENFFVGKLESRSKYTIRVLAHTVDTKVFLNSKLVATLGVGEFYENSELTKNSIVTSNYSVLVAQYSHGFTSGDDVGDPMMLLVSPTEQFLKEYRFATPKNGEWLHYVNIVIPTSSIKSLLIDDNSLDENAVFQQVGNTSYSIKQHKVGFGTHTISADQPFGMCSYGFGFGSQAYDAYGTMGGQSLNPIDATTNSTNIK